jgi:hypothetical protein
VAAGNHLRRYDEPFLFGAGTTSAGGVLEIIYSYHEAEATMTAPTPEPSSFLLIGAVLAAVPLLRRRKSTLRP